MNDIWQQSYDKEQLVQKIFTLIAPRYDVINTILSFNRDRYWRRFTAAQARIRPGDHVLDVCCGSGKLCLELAHYVGDNGCVVGLDFCENMLAEAVKNLSHSTWGKAVQLVRGSALALPFADNTFDCVTIGFGLRNVDNMEMALTELVRVVKPGGTVVSLELGKPGLPIFRQLYAFYFCCLLPQLGKIGIGADGPYRYLPLSWKAFPGQKELSRRFEDAGLEELRYFDLTGGIACVHTGIKPASKSSVELVTPRRVPAGVPDEFRPPSQS